MITLYQHPLSTYAMKVKIALREKGIDFASILPDGMADGTAGGEFVDASPRRELGAVRVDASSMRRTDRWALPSFA